jgi:hypothetical protein
MEGQLFISKSHVLCGHESRQENVDTLSDCERHGNDTISTWLTVQAANKI